MKNKTLTMPFNLFKTGVSTDSFTPMSAMLMGASVLLYGTIQVSWWIMDPSRCSQEAQVDFLRQIAACAIRMHAPSCMQARSRAMARMCISALSG